MVSTLNPSFYLYKTLSVHTNREYNLHTHPPPASPSHRVRLTLLLLHTLIPATQIRAYLEAPYFPPASFSDELGEWVDVVSGEREKMSEGVEEKVRESLVEICGKIKTEAQVGIKRLRKWVEGLEEGEKEGVREGVEAMNRLWEGERRVARAVEEELKRGIQ